MMGEEVVEYGATRGETGRWKSSKKSAKADIKIVALKLRSQATNLMWSTSVGERNSGME